MGVWKFDAYNFANIFTNWMIRVIRKVKMFTPGPLLSFEKKEKKKAVHRLVRWEPEPLLMPILYDFPKKNHTYLIEKVISQKLLQIS